MRPGALPTDRPGPTPLAASVVVASHGRPALLSRLLAALGRQIAPPFEVVVVSPEAPAPARGLRHLRSVAANVSASRNAGIAAASAPIVAFCDDDAIPEPTWLCRLLSAFTDERVAAAGGLVLGRDGLSVEWQPETVDAFGRTLGTVARAGPVSATPGRFARVHGTNAAFRRSALVSVSGFDEAFRYYLDETDLCLRLAGAGWQVAAVPEAVVHHARAGGPYRDTAGVPTDLREIGAAKAAFLDRHAITDSDARAAELARFAAEQRRRLVRFMLAGRLDPSRIEPLLRGLEAGFAEGAGRAQRLASLPAPAPGGDAYCAGAIPGPLLWGTAGRRHSLRAAAEEAAGEGRIVTVLELGWNGFRHRSEFRDEGYWLQRGGVLGRSGPQRPPRVSMAGRAALEAGRIGRTRPHTGLHRP